MHDHIHVLHPFLLPLLHDTHTHTYMGVCIRCSATPACTHACTRRQAVWYTDLPPPPKLMTVQVPCAHAQPLVACLCFPTSVKGPYEISDLDKVEWWAALHMSVYYESLEGPRCNRFIHISFPRTRRHESDCDSSKGGKHNKPFLLKKKKRHNNPQMFSSMMGNDDERWWCFYSKHDWWRLRIGSREQLARILQLTCLVHGQECGRARGVGGGFEIHTVSSSSIGNATQFFTYLLIFQVFWICGVLFRWWKALSYGRIILLWIQSNWASSGGAAKIWGRTLMANFHSGAPK